MLRKTLFVFAVMFCFSLFVFGQTSQNGWEYLFKHNNPQPVNPVLQGRINMFPSVTITIKPNFPKYLEPIYRYKYSMQPVTITLPISDFDPGNELQLANDLYMEAIRTGNATLNSLSNAIWRLDYLINANKKKK